MLSTISPVHAGLGSWLSLQHQVLDFQLSGELEAGEPPEARGLRRDEVRLMVSYWKKDRVVHTKFNQLLEYLKPGDVLVVNTSGTMNAALPVTRSDGTPLELHLSTHLPEDLWVLELRKPEGDKTHPFFNAHPGEQLLLPGSGLATLHAPYLSGQRADRRGSPGRVRLWVASLDLPEALLPYLDQYGFPIRYAYVREKWPISYYQTVYSTEVGSAEMPSAGRAFTPELLTRLVAHGVLVLPVVLHTGVASLEDHEPPYEEYFRVPAATARALNAARAAGEGRIIAVGTTVVRALESAVDEQGMVYPHEGWTDLVITPERGLRVVNGLLTGLHEPRSTHILMLETLAGPDHLRHTYAEAIGAGYLWHEFGDLHLLLP